MSSQLPTTVELEFAERYDREHAQVCSEVRPKGFVRRLALWREQRLVRRALKVAGEPGLVLDLACGAGRFWPLLAEHGNRVILAADSSQGMLDHAQTHHPVSLLARIKLFKSSVFSIDMSENAVDSIFCMQLFHHVRDSEHRLAILPDGAGLSGSRLCKDDWARLVVPGSTTPASVCRVRISKRLTTEEVAALPSSYKP